MNQTRKHGRSALPTNSAPRSAADSQTRPMSTEEYLRTEVFGDQNRMQQKRMANLAQLERRAEDTPISMEEYVRHIVYAEDLPDATSCAPVAQHAIPVVMSRPTPAVAARAAVPYATPDKGHNASGTALQGFAVPNNRNSASIPRYAGAAATGLGSCCVVLPSMRHGGSAVGSATQPAVLSGMQPDTQPDTQPPRLNVRLQRNAQGRIIRKLEGAGDSMREYCFAYDAQGHLTHAWLNGSLVEQYATRLASVWQMKRYGAAPAALPTTEQAAWCRLATCAASTRRKVPSAAGFAQPGMGKRSPPLPMAQTAGWTALSCLTVRRLPITTALHSVRRKST
ncbi:hypothetical protein LN040_11440 [Desulfovibrio subterraneus]|uniref:hypothetical protein n=1 Tax=Desulfovibrio subterraneus TaxID=2718620 RepID=UPI0022B8A8F8|nr:hypothetical protein [Desulfovibrio subterraneus]WBF66342.1 hypothetical protein LN040_11440 [Desulfovibrio subterraneus]